MSCNRCSGTGGTGESNTSDCQDSCNNLLAVGSTSSCSGCGCSATPTPFYNQAGACQETHTQMLVQRSYVTGITTSAAFNIPNCHGTAVVTFPGLQKILVGGYIWNPTYGYLKVVSFDYANSTITVENDCIGTNVPGTLVPACTLFTVVDTPCCTGSQTGPSSIYPFLAVDFVAPANGNCIDIAVTNTNGLVVGYTISIGGGSYRISAILSSTLITICNDGFGVIPGTTVYAEDAGGNLINPLIVVGTNPCANTPEDIGTLLVCQGDKVAPLDASEAGQIPVCIDPTTNEVEFMTMDINPILCTEILTGFSTSVGTYSYNIHVSTSGIFSSGQVLRIGAIADDFVITGLPDPTHVVVTWYPVGGYPGIPTAIPAGTMICDAGCCAQINHLLVTPCDWVIGSRFGLAVDNVSAGEAPNPVTHMSAGDETAILSANRTVANITCKTMHVQLISKFRAIFEAHCLGSSLLSISGGGTMSVDHAHGILTGYAAQDIAVTPVAPVLGGGDIVGITNQEYVYMGRSGTDVESRIDLLTFATVTIPAFESMIAAIGVKFKYEAGGTVDRLNLLEVYGDLQIVGISYT